MAFRQEAEMTPFLSLFSLVSAGSRNMVLSKQEKEAAKLGLSVFTVKHFVTIFINVGDGKYK